MAKLDLQYKAFKALRGETKLNLELSKERKQIMESNTDLDHFDTTKYGITIKEDWIIKIEKGLEFVEKAIGEERQFIRVDGEIVPIEKVKKVGRSSVEYLSRHANMITHLPEDGKDLTPDELYITEKNADYAVYENRFLYMLLKYLEEFINFRIEKIEKLRSTYVSSYSVNKKIDTGKREVTYKEEVTERRTDNPYPIYNKETEDRLKRIKDIQSIVSALLNTNLMSDVSKTPLIKPPITKTNVLKMNNNFKNALALYEYISSYQGKGYEAEEVKTSFVPFESEAKDELAEVLELSSFLTYKIGNNIEKSLNTEYLNQERLKREEEERKLEERIKRLKKRALESSRSMEEYMALLEIRNQQLLKDSEELSLARNEINNLNKEIDKLNIEKDQLNERIDELNLVIEEKLIEIANLKQKYIDDMAAIKAKHASEIESLVSKHESELNDTIDDYEAEIDELKDKQYREIDSLRKDYENEISNIELRERETKEEYESRISNINDTISNLEEDKKKLRLEYETKIQDINLEHSSEIDSLNQIIESKDELIDTIEQDKNFYLAELTSMKVMKKEVVPSEELATRERFIELEKEYKAFQRFFDEQWKIAKRKIRNDLREQALSNEEIKPTEEKNETEEEIEK